MTTRWRVAGSVSCLPPPASLETPDGHSAAYRVLQDVGSHSRRSRRSDHEAKPAEVRQAKKGEAVTCVWCRTRWPSPIARSAVNGKSTDGVEYSSLG
jgi:hypothetical protein